MADKADISLADFRGKRLVVNFYASYCLPCRDEAPLFARAARRNHGKVVFLAIDTQDARPDGRRFAEQYELPFVGVYDGSGSVGREYGLTGIPETYFIDADGRAVAHIVGRADESDLASGLLAFKSS